ACWRLRVGQRRVGGGVAAERAERDEAIGGEVELRECAGRLRSAEEGEAKADINRPGDPFVLGGLGRCQGRERGGEVAADRRNVLPGENRRDGLCGIYGGL